ncbi:MAG: RNA-binding protein [Rhizobiales bacterium]|nr:RNA-binding protein [Hyphomicrobiales bacterium]
MLARLQDSNGDADAGPRSDQSVTERMCIATRTVKPIGEMIRFVVAPDGTVVPDLKRKLPGRGIWVTATRDALAQAVKRKAIGTGFKRDVRADAGLVVLTDGLLERAVLDALAICGKASLAVMGFAKVDAALAREPVVALLHASGAAADGVRKLDAALQRRFDDANRVRIVTDLSSDQLDLALARPNVVHAALLAGSVSDTFLARHARLTRFRTGSSPGGNDARRTEGAED